jgi:hypothetical protein
MLQDEEYALSRIKASPLRVNQDIAVSVKDSILFEDQNASPEPIADTQSPK